MTTPKRLARTAGGLYLLMAVLGVFAHLFVRDAAYVPGDAASTAEQIVANPTLFRLALVADIGMATVFVFLGLVLYLLLGHVDRRAAAVMVVFVTVGAAMTLANLVFHHAALLVATDASYSSALGVAGGDALVLLLLDLHHYGYTIAGVFFGLWLLPLGYLAHKSGMFPRALGVLLIIAGVSWLVDTLTRFAAPDLPEMVHFVLTAPTFGEFWMLLYLLTKGVRAARPDERVAVTA